MAYSAPSPSGGGSVLLTDRGAVHIGHWKQLRVHLGGNVSCNLDVKGGWGLPVSFTLHTAAGNLKQTVRAVPAYYLVQHTSRTADLVAVLAVEEVLERIQAIVGSRSSRVEGAFVFVCFFSAGWVDSSDFLGRDRRVCAGALEICIWLELGHVVLWKLERIIFGGSRLRALR